MLLPRLHAPITSAADVIRHRDIPPDFAVVMSGHIHRHQVLTTDLQRRALATPVIYPGSIERTATAEIGETKGYVVLTLAPEDPPRWEFRELPARPMIRRDVDPTGLSGEQLAAIVGQVIAESPADAVLYLRMTADLTAEQWPVLSSPRLRAMAPSTMNVELLAPNARLGKPEGAGRSGQ